MKHFTILVFCILCISSYSQDRIVGGLVVDYIKRPIEGVAICQLNSTNICITDYKGEFKLSINNNLPLILYFSSVGLISEQVDISDTSNNTIEITMLEEVKSLINPIYAGNELNSIVFSFSFDRFDANFNDYSEFTPEYLRIFNNKSISYYYNIAIGGYFHNFLGSFGYGISIPSSNTLDSIRIAFSSEKLEFMIGYGLSIIKSRMVITPYITFDRLRYRLLTSDESKTISLSKYLSENQQDLSICQWMSTVGVNLDFKLYSKPDRFLFYSTYLSIGTGYSFRLSKAPKIRADVNEISSDSRIKYQNFYLQASLRFYIHE